ncbi:MAG TPA: dihydrodipicolinate synthase family protein [Coriobacteriia bacterium]
MFTPQGVIPALVTPLDSDGGLMEDALRNVIDFTIAGGVHGIFVLGSSGEIYGLDDAQKRRVVEISAEHINGRVPLYAGASEITTRDAIKTARMVQSIGGVTALSVLTPYFMTPTQSELIEHFTAIAASTDLPILLYGNEGKTHVKITVETNLALSAVENIIGIKDSSGDMSLMLDYLSTAPDGFSILAGRDTLIYAGLCHGATGAIASTANIAPRLVAEIYNAFIAGDHTRALELQFALIPLRKVLDAATFPVVLKEGLRLAGIDAGYCLAPARELAPDKRERLAAVIADIGNLPGLAEKEE